MELPFIYFPILLLLILVPPKNGWSSWGTSWSSTDNDDDSVERKEYDGILEITKAFFAQYNNNTMPGDDAIAQLGFISARAATLMEFTRPISGLIAAGLQMAFSPESSEFKAIQFLHTNVLRKFAQQNSLINGMVHKIKEAGFLNDYQNTITIPLKTFDSLLALIMDPNRNRSFWAPEFRAECALDKPQSPLKMLEYMETNINFNCQPQNDSVSFAEVQQQIISDCRSLFEEFIARMRRRHDHRITYLAALTLAKLEKLPIGEQQKRLAKIAEIFKNSAKISADVTSATISNIFRDVKEEKLCLLRILYEANDQKRRPLEGFASIVQLHLERISMISTFCANITNNGMAEKIEWQSNETARLVNWIGTNATKWMLNELENAWPRVMMESAEKAVGEEDVRDPYKYNKTAIDVWASVSKRGLKKFVYQVLVTPNWEQIGQFWYSGCPSNWCTIIRNHRLLNIVLTRHHSREYLRADEAQKWFDASEGNISAVIDNNGKVSDLGTLQKRIEAVVGPLTNSTHFRSAVLLHNGAWTAKSTKIPVGLAKSMGTLGEYVFIERLIEHPIFDDERFKIFLFL